MTHAIRMHQIGGPEVLKWESVEVAAPGPGEVTLKQSAVGLNFIDTYHRSGVYPVGDLPAILGREAVGQIDVVGPDVTDWTVGDRAAYVLEPGAYTELKTIRADRLIRLPDSISDSTIAASLLKGLTAQFLIRRTYPVKKGETLLVHAAAGGVGTLLCQWARHLGATVIGTVGSAEKAELAKANGCTHPVRYDQENFLDRVKELTDGKGVPVVYDSVGQETFERSLDCLQPRGLLVSFGQSSGLIPPFSINMLAGKGSLFVTRPTLAHYVSDPTERDEAVKELVGLLHTGALGVAIGQTFPLAEAADAHRALESRNTRGATVLLP